MRRIVRLKKFGIFLMFSENKEIYDYLQIGKLQDDVGICEFQKIYFLMDFWLFYELFIVYVGSYLNVNEVICKIFCLRFLNLSLGFCCLDDEFSVYILYLVFDWFR